MIGCNNLPGSSNTKDKIITVFRFRMSLPVTSCAESLLSDISAESLHGVGDCGFCAVIAVKRCHCMICRTGTIDINSAVFLIFLANQEGDPDVANKDPWNGLCKMQCT